MSRANIETNAKFELHLSPESIEEYKKFLQNYAHKIPRVAENIVRRVSDVGLENNYNSVTTLPITNKGNKVEGGIKSNSQDDTYAEFGTGIVGLKNPHVADWLAKSGWKYDINEHGEKGWVYFRNGEYHRTKGIPAHKKFYEATERMATAFPDIAKEEFRNASS